MKRPVIITLENLPARTRRLSGDELSKVFGGCHKSFGHCSHNRDCCYSSCNPYGRCAAVGGSPF
jgi:hypothetical protein